ncbi:hypothetical protein T484DRAFT_1745433 [Baffinella frigidus]|nr:hypothetical protein T484DRAFT_1745433 [Cryptophyta sp. CCMP2293]
MATLFARIGRSVLATVPTHHPRFASYSFGPRNNGPPRHRSGEPPRHRSGEPPRHRSGEVTRSGPGTKHARVRVVGWSQETGGLGEELGDIGRMEVLNKAIAASGFSSRRHAALLVAEGRVTVAIPLSIPGPLSLLTCHLSSMCAQVNGKEVREPGYRVDVQQDVVEVDSEKLELTPRSV